MPTKSRYYNSAKTIQSALTLHNEVVKIESEVESSTKENEYRSMRNLHSGYIHSVILGSYRFIDIAINEAIEDILRDHEMKTRMQMELDEKLISDIRVIDNSFRRGICYNNMLFKVQIVLVLADSEPFDTSRAPLQEVLTLKRLRNYFEHYQPEDISHNDQNIPSLGESIKSSLRGFSEEEPKINPFSRSDSPYFPEKCMSSTCTGWACSTAKTFVLEFYDRLGVTWPANLPDS